MIYVMSDIHGSRRRFDAVMEQIKLTDEDTLYILGDVIDRGEHGVELLQRIRAAKNMRMILGNHEYMMLCLLALMVVLAARSVRATTRRTGHRSSGASIGTETAGTLRTGT